jgi:hypothetical protein
MNNYLEDALLLTNTNFVSSSIPGSNTNFRIIFKSNNFKKERLLGIEKIIELHK